MANSETTAKKNILPYKFFVLTFFIAVIFRLIFCLYFYTQDAARISDFFSESDMQANKAWAEKISKGNYLSRDPFHPFHSWMKQIAPLKKWEDWWGGREIFQQAPLYPYFLALAMKITGAKDLYIRMIQMVIGALSILLLTMTAYNFYGQKAAFFTALIAIFYYPLYFFEFFFLRDFLSLHFLCWLLLTCSIMDKEQFKNPAAIFGAGIISGLSILTRENMIILIPLFILIFIFRKKQSDENSVQMIIAYLTGLLLILSPLFYRNYIVDAPLFSLSNRLIEGVIEGLAFDSTPIFMCIPESMERYLNEGNGAFLKTLQLIINDYPSFSVFIHRVLTKCFWLFFYLEPFNNINLYFLKESVSIFSLFIGYPFIFLFFPLSLPFIARKGKIPLFLIWMLLFSSLIVPPVLARYRLIILPFYFIWIGAAIGEIYESKNGRFYLSCLLTMLFIIALSLDLFLPKRFISRPTENIILERISAQE